MFLCGITLVPWQRSSGQQTWVFSVLFNVDDVGFGESVQRSAHLLKLLLERGKEQRYLPEPARSLFIVDLTNQEEAEKR